MSKQTTIVLFRNDLRVSDHPALSAAAEAGRVLALYVLDEEAAGNWKPGGASRWWLHHSLECLAQSLSNRGCRLILRRGDTRAILTELVREVAAEAVFVSRAFEPWAADLEVKLRDALARDDVSLKRFAGTLVHDPDVIRTQSGDPYKVYSPFWRALEKSVLRKVARPPERIACAGGDIRSDELAGWRLLPTKPDWAGGLRETWTPGEAGAHARLETFLEEAVATYHDDRERPDREATSRLSPHLRFGEISPAICWHAAQAFGDNTAGTRKGVEKFVKELAWREFSYHLLHNFPALPDAPFRPEFARFGWRDAPDELSRWQRGQTGYPIVDAGMRELWATGWMHNRVRMIVASFLTKDLLVPWQQGEAWFWETLVDADLASNAASWQWVAGCGADAAPYFRIFNPVTQGRKFDPDGAYVKRWVPELTGLPAMSVHAPWEASDAVLAAAGIRLGRDYPVPMVDHAEARKEALSRYEAMKVG
jgi:deoxyribodipyrimidine photo-lyase